VAHGNQRRSRVAQGLGPKVPIPRARHAPPSAGLCGARLPRAATTCATCCCHFLQQPGRTYAIFSGTHRILSSPIRIPANPSGIQRTQYHMAVNRKGPHDLRSRPARSAADKQHRRHASRPAACSARSAGQRDVVRHTDGIWRPVFSQRMTLRRRRLCGRQPRMSPAFKANEPRKAELW
jgi:hypothetical protein